MVTAQGHLATTRNVAVILLNWNTADLTLACIKSLMESNVTPSRILVWDNGSSPESATQIAGSCPAVELHRNDNNVGFAAANNLCIKRLQTDGFDYIWVLNNDTVVDPDCLSSFLEHMEEHPETDVATGKILLYDCEKNRIWYAGGTFNEWTLSSRHYGQGKLDSKRYNTEKSIRFVSGCCMFTRTGAWDAIGLFNESFFAYLEDLDWSIRAVRRGTVMRFVPEAVLWHVASASTLKNTMLTQKGRISSFEHYLSARNQIFILRAHCRGALHILVAYLGVFADNLLILGGLLLYLRWKKIARRIKGIADGFYLSYE